MKMLRGSIHEVILSTYFGNEPYAAPIGVTSCESNVLRARIYKGSRLWEACRTSSAFIVNVCFDPMKFVQAVLRRGELEFFEYGALRQPAIRGCEGYLECVKLGLIEESPSYGSLYLQILGYEVRRLVPYTRCLGLLIEVLVELTRVWAKVKSCNDVAPKLSLLLRDARRLCGSEVLEPVEKALVDTCGDSNYVGATYSPRHT